jgi:hypothetical protein
MGTITRNFANNILGTGEVDATDGVNGTIPATNVADASLNNVTSLPSSVGYAIKSVASDPPSLNAGEIFYNSTAGAFKALVNVEAWSSGSPLLSPQRDGGYGQSSPTTTAWIAGGTNASTRNITTTQEYNGSGWSTGGNTNTGREEITGFGLVSASVLAGGATYPPSALKNEVEEYDGSSWTAATALPTKRKNAAGCGTQTAGLVAFGALDPPSTSGGKTATSLEYDGTSWTAGGTGNTARVHAKGSAGSQTAGLAFGGEDVPPSNLDTTEEYDGSTWTTGGALNTARSLMAGSGIQTSALAYGGFTPYSAKTENYNGTSWSNSPDLSTARDRLQGGGTDSSNAIAAGGLIGTSPYTVNLTEEFNSSTNTIVAAAWSSGGSLPGSGRQGYGVGTGTQTATIAAGGPPDSTQNQFYDGLSWTNLASIPSGVTNSQGFGDSEELLMAGGNVTSPYSALTYVYSRPGDSWTVVSPPGNLNTARAMGAGCGALSTAGIIAGGENPSYTTATESWDGSTWTTVNALPTATGSGVGSCGTQTAGLAWSGQNPGDPTAEETYEWDGTNWTSGGNRIIGVRAVRGGAGTQTAALTFGGWLDPGGSVYTEGYDGTAWSTRPNMAGGAANNFQTGTQTAALRAGGTDGPGYTAVEEFTGETITQVAKTLSSS